MMISLKVKNKDSLEVAGRNCQTGPPRGSQKKQKGRRRMFKETGYVGRRMSDGGFPFAKEGTEHKPVPLVIGEIEIWLLNAGVAISEWLGERFGLMLTSDKRRELSSCFVDLMQKGWEELSVDDQAKVRQAVEEINQIIRAFCLDSLCALNDRIGLPSTRRRRSPQKVEHPEIRELFRRLNRDLQKGIDPKGGDS
jgi:hypothetical protein